MNGRNVRMGNGLDDRIWFHKTTRPSKGVEIRERVEADASDRKPRMHNAQLVTKLERQ